MNPNKASWEKGDFTRIAESMRDSCEALVKGFGITQGLKVLDLGCGDGTTAIPGARLGEDVLGVDIAHTSSARPAAPPHAATDPPTVQLRVQSPGGPGAFAGLLLL